MGSQFKTNLYLCLSLLGMGILSFLNAPCFMACVFKTSPSCNHECKGGITLFGTSVFYFMDIMAIAQGTYNDLNEVYPMSNAHPWCNTRKEYPDEGVDMHKHPTGWIQQPDGSWKGCEEQSNNPVMQVPTINYNTFHDVKRLMQEFPRAEYNHTVHRQNGFAFTMASGAMHNDINPPLALLASPVELRLKTNPLIRKIFRPERIGRDTQQRLRNIVRTHIQEQQETMDLHTTSFEMVWNMIFDIIFPGHPFPFPVMETFDLYSEYFKIMVVPTMFTPDFLHGYFTKDVKEQIKPHLKLFRELILAQPDMFGVDLHTYNCDWNEDEPNDCLDYLAQGVLDFFALAGGAALPKLMRVVLWTLYETDERREQYNGLFMSLEDSRNFARASSKGYMLESLRFFTMVTQFPYWDGPFEEAGYKGLGKGEPKVRRFLNIASATKDPNVFGPDAHLFRHRDHKFLAEHNMAFADFVRDETLFNGGNDHYCPAKDAAILIGSIIVEELGLDGNNWQVSEKWNPTYTSTIPYVSYDDHIVLKRTARESDTVEEDVPTMHDEQAQGETKEVQQEEYVEVEQAQEEYLETEEVQQEEYKEEEVGQEAHIEAEQAQEEYVEEEPPHEENVEAERIQHEEYVEAEPAHQEHVEAEHIRHEEYVEAEPAHQEHVEAKRIQHEEYVETE